MQQRAKAEQHLRRIKGGKVVVVNKGTVKKRVPGAGNELKKVSEENENPFHTQGLKFEMLRKDLKIPPAWTEVKISKDKESDLLATGKDSKGRKQYIYSLNATMKSAEAKFKRNKQLLKAQEGILATNNKNISSKNKTVSETAHVFNLVQATGLRPGSERETGGAVKAYGATTLEGRHVVVKNNEVRLKFVGKKGVSIDIPVTDKVVAKNLIAQKRKVSSTQKLYSVTDMDLRNYTKTLGKGNFKPKDFRTLKGTSIAMEELKGMKQSASMQEYKKTVMGIAKKVSTALGNTPSIALKSYINPFVFLTIKPD